MMKTWSKRITIGALGAVVCLGFAAPLAHADVIETGTKTCGGSTPFSYVQYKTKGDRAVRAPGSGTTRVRVRLIDFLVHQFAAGSRRRWVMVRKRLR